MAQEVTQRLVPLEAAEEHFLVVARKDAHAAALGPFARRGDDAGTVGSAVHEIAEQDHRGIRRLARCLVRLDARNHAAEQIAAAMDVSDGVDPLTFRHRRTHFGHRSAVEKGAKEFQHERRA